MLILILNGAHISFCHYFRRYLKVASHLTFLIKSKFWLDPHLQPMNRRYVGYDTHKTHTQENSQVVVVICQKVKRGVTTIEKVRT